MGTTEELAEFAASLKLSDVPAGAIDNAVLAIADSIGTLYAGLAEDSVRLLGDVVADEGGAPRASVFGTGRKTSVGSAALLNGAAAHALDFDSISLSVSGFVASPVLYALLALAEAQQEPVSGERLLEAFIAGWEVEAAIARGLGVLHYRKGWHSTATLGHFGAAVAGARLLDCSTGQMRSAMGIAASEASGLRTMIGRMTNPFHVGKAARNGALAAQLAVAGFDAEPSVIEHPQGVAAAFNGSDGFDLALMTAALGTQWDLMDPGLVIKVYPCCGLIHSAIDAAIALKEEHDIDPDRIADVEVSVHAFVPPTMIIDRPTSAYEAKFSTPFCVAVPLMDGAVRLGSFTERRIGDAATQRLMGKVRMVVHPEQLDTDTFLEREFSIVTVTMSDGAILSRRVNRIENVGSRGNPATAAIVRDKAAYCIGDRHAGALAALPRLLDIGSEPDIAALLAILR